MSTVVLALGPIFVHLHMMFPERSVFRGRRALLASIYGTGFVLWLLSTGLDLVYYLRLAQGSSDLISLTPVVEAHFVTCILIGLALLDRTERAPNRRRANEAYPWFFWAWPWPSCRLSP